MANQADVKLEWELIDQYHFRCRVVGGWIIKCMDPVYEHEPYRQTGEHRIAMVFVPDYNNIWHNEGWRTYQDGPRKR